MLAARRAASLGARACMHAYTHRDVINPFLRFWRERSAVGTHNFAVNDRHCYGIYSGSCCCDGTIPGSSGSGRGRRVGSDAHNNAERDATTLLLWGWRDQSAFSAFCFLQWLTPLGLLIEKLQLLFTGHDPTRRSRHKLIEISRVEWGRVRKSMRSHGTGRVGPGGFESRGSGRVTLAPPGP